jgi:acyl-CoA thioesterase I
MQMKKVLLLLAMVFVVAMCGRAQNPPAQQPAANQTANCAELQKRIDQWEAWLKDWLHLSRYREADAALAAPAKDEARGVFMGDSITDIWKNIPAGFSPANLT